MITVAPVLPACAHSPGVIDALREAGIQEGDTVSMYDLEFDFVN